MARIRPRFLRLAPMLRIGMWAAARGIRAWNSLTPRERAELWGIAVAAGERRFRLTQKERKRAFELARRAARGKG